MISITAISLFLGVWASIYLLDVFLKRHIAHRYADYQERAGITLSFVQVRCYMTWPNRIFIKMGRLYPRALKVWFSLGVVFGLVAMVFSIIVLATTLFNTLNPHNNNTSEQQLLTPVMPGVNLPIQQIGYYLLTLLICGVLHEVGHAVAAVREQVRVNGFGVFLFAIYPGAFVDLFTDHLQMISPMRQLRIYCAGVWHNFVIVLVSLACLLALPWMLHPLYSYQNGILVTDIQPHSAVYGQRGFVVGTVISSINECKTLRVEEWISCLQQSLLQEPPGYCMPVEQILRKDVSSHKHRTPYGNVDCCPNSSVSEFCFVWRSKSHPQENYACLPARSATDRVFCKLNSECYNMKQEMSCAFPSLDNSSRLLRVVHSQGAALLFVGNPWTLHFSLGLSDYVPKFTLVSASVPYIIELLCKYLISLSGALAILNVVPCYALDGQWILAAFIELSLKTCIPSRSVRTLIYTVLLFFGTVLLLANVMTALFVLFFR